MSEIIPHVYLSSVVYAKDSYWLKKNKITHILTIGNLESYFPDKFKYKRIQIEDKPESNIKQHFQECIDHIDAIVTQNKNILIHCYGGQSRSVTIVTAYIMKKLRLNSERAFAYVKQKHSRAEPNQGFLDQLKTFELD